MKEVARASVVYFPLVFIYKLFGVYDNNYWVNSYWFLTALYFTLVFVSIRNYCLDKTYKRIIVMVAYYWGVMAALRFYLFFNIGLYDKIISSANTLKIGGVSIVVLLIYLSVWIKWFKK